MRECLTVSSSALGSQERRSPNGSLRLARKFSFVTSDRTSEGTRTIIMTMRACSCTSTGRTSSTRIHVTSTSTSRISPSGGRTSIACSHALTGNCCRYRSISTRSTGCTAPATRRSELDAFFKSVAEPVAHIRTSEDVIVSKVGRELYEKFFRNYTRKQWGLDPSELDASVTSRVPVRTNRDDRYFTDTYQVMPLGGYTRMFERMLAHPNIKILLNANYREVAESIPHTEVIFTGPVDEFFDYRFGKLPYRSLDFKFETLNVPVAQQGPVIDRKSTR